MGLEATHEIGRPECVAERCEPRSPERPMLPPYDDAERDLVRKLGGGVRARSAAKRIVR